MGAWGGGQEVCASCRYWMGRRDIDFSASHFLAHDSVGYCQGPMNGSFRGIEIGEGATCSAWEAFRDRD